MRPASNMKPLTQKKFALPLMFAMIVKVLHQRSLKLAKKDAGLFLITEDIMLKSLV